MNWRDLECQTINPCICNSLNRHHFLINNYCLFVVCLYVYALNCKAESYKSSIILTSFNVIYIYENTCEEPNMHKFFIFHFFDFFLLWIIIQQIYFSRDFIMLFNVKNEIIIAVRVYFIWSSSYIKCMHA